MKKKITYKYTKLSNKKKNFFLNYYIHRIKKKISKIKIYKINITKGNKNK